PTMRDRKAPHAQEAVSRFAGGIVIRPCDVIVGARGQHRHVVRGGEMLGDETAVPLRPAGDVLAETMDDAGELHRPAIGLAGGTRAVSSRRRRAFSIASSSRQAITIRLT